MCSSTKTCIEISAFCYRNGLIRVCGVKNEKLCEGNNMLQLNGLRIGVSPGMFGFLCQTKCQRLYVCAPAGGRSL